MGRGAHEQEMFASAEVETTAEQRGRTYISIVGLARGPVIPECVSTVALILKWERRNEIPAVTFGSNYELSVRSLELERGFADALDYGWIELSGGRVAVRPQFVPPDAPDDVRDRADELFSLSRADLTRMARPYLLREAALTDAQSRPSEPQDGRPRV